MYTGIRAYVNNLRNKFRISNYSGGNIKEDEMSVACREHCGDGKDKQYFGRNYGLDDRGSIPGQGFFSSPPRTDWLGG
jgi:hypothetical protein